MRLTIRTDNLREQKPDWKLFATFAECEQEIHPLKKTYSQQVHVWPRTKTSCVMKTAYLLIKQRGIGLSLFASQYTEFLPHMTTLPNNGNIPC